MFSLYTFFKFLHVAAVIIWIGGVGTLSVLNMRLARLQDRNAVAVLAQQSEFLGRVLIGPAALLTLIAGIATAAQAGFPFSMLWITWGFAAILGSLLLGALFIRRATGKLGELATVVETGDSRLTAAQRRLTLLNMTNVLLLLSAVGAMVFKPVL